jgi:hypothetical protein
MAVQSFVAQMICNDCQQVGTLEAFGVLADLNIGLVNSPEGGEYLEESLYEPLDPQCTIRITVNLVEGLAIANIWLREWGQWIKVLPEVAIPAMTLSQIYQSQVMRLVQDKRFIDPRMMLILNSLMIKARL